MNRSFKIYVCICCIEKDPVKEMSDSKCDLLIKSPKHYDKGVHTASLGKVAAKHLKYINRKHPEQNVYT